MYLAQTKRWTMERIIRLMAGVFVLAGTALGHGVHPAWLVVPALVAANLAIFSLTGFCPAAVLLHRCGVEEE
jgi:hypothetical protein